MRGLSVLWSSLVMASCAAESSRSTPQSPTPAPAVPVAPAASSSPAPSPSAEPSVAPTGAPTSRPIPERRGAPGSTRGTVSCGITRCSAPGEVCFFDRDRQAWACRPDGPEPATGPFDDTIVRCDDGFDCPDGQTCCAAFGSYESVCVARRDVRDRCAAELCVRGGARCPPGRTCVIDEVDEGTCDAPEGPATCAGKAPCPSDRPICAVAEGRAFCVAEGSPEHRAVPGHRRYRCTRQSDCHLGDTCQWVFGEIQHEMATFCGPYKPGFGGSVACEPRPGEPCHPPEGELAKLLPWLGVLGM